MHIEKGRDSNQAHADHTLTSDSGGGLGGRKVDGADISLATFRFRTRLRKSIGRGWALGVSASLVRSLAGPQRGL